MQDLKIETLHITFEPEEDGWKCTVEDWYQLSGYGDTKYEALVEAVKMVRDWLED